MFAPLIWNDTFRQLVAALNGNFWGPLLITRLVLIKSISLLRNTFFSCAFKIDSQWKVVATHSITLGKLQNYMIGLFYFCNQQWWLTTRHRVRVYVKKPLEMNKLQNNLLAIKMWLSHHIFLCFSNSLQSQWFVHGNCSCHFGDLFSPWIDMKLSCCLFPFDC